jgi:hypothetical protein
MSEHVTIPNWKRGERYMWAHAASLACLWLSGEALFKRKDGKPPLFHLNIRRPKDAEPGQFHRVRIEVVRTKKEAAAMDRKWRKRRKEFADKMKTVLGTKVNVTEFMKP